MRFLLLIAFFQMLFGPAFGDEINMNQINQVSREDFNFGSLGTQFQKAVGYAGGQANTNDRIGLGKGFYNQIIAGELTPLASLTKTEPIDVGAGKSQVQ